MRGGLSIFGQSGRLSHESTAAKIPKSKAHNNNDNNKKTDVGGRNPLFSFISRKENLRFFSSNTRYIHLLSMLRSDQELCSSQMPPTNFYNYKNPVIGTLYSTIGQERTKKRSIGPEEKRGTRQDLTVRKYTKRIY